jgi:hypothetical protein
MAPAASREVVTALPAARDAPRGGSTGPFVSLRPRTRSAIQNFAPGFNALFSDGGLKTKLVHG